MNPDFSAFTLPSKPILHLLRDFIPHISGRRRKQFFLVLVLMLAGAAAELITLGAVIPFIALMADPSAALDYPLLQRLFTSLGWQSADSIVLPMTLLFLLVVAGATAVRLLLLWVSTRWVFALGYDVGVSMYARVLNQPYSFHITRNTSEIIAAVNKVQAVLNGTVRPIMDGIISTALAVAIITALILIEPVATIAAAVVFISLYLIISGLTRLKLRLNGKHIAAAQTQRIRCVQEGLGSIRDVLLDHSQAQYTTDYARADQRLRRAQASSQLLKRTPSFLMQSLAIVLIVILAYSFSHRDGGLIATLPLLGALALGAQRLIPLLQKIYDAWASLISSHQMFVDVLELLSLPVPQATTRETRRLPFEHELRLEGVSFTYPQTETGVLKNIDLVIPRGSRVGIVGPSGSGKSTLVDLIMTLLVPDQGRLLVDGTPLDEHNRASWQNHVSHVPQHIFLADASIAENIAIGVPQKKIDHDRVVEAARAARIHEFIAARQRGYASPVGERGIQLSGGQRQRLGIARAIYRQASVLVLDEATSALDNDTETSVINCLDDLGDDLTIIMIAHRLTTLSSCNLIIQLDAGRVIQTGSFQQIIGEPATATQPIHQDH